MSLLCCTINGVEVNCEAGTSILEAARSAGISIPTLCYLEGINKLGGCRLCVVEIEGMPRPIPACVTPVKDGMRITTQSAALRDSRRQAMDRLCRQHRMDCEYCPDYTFCELHAAIRALGMDDRPYSEVYHERRADDSSRCLIRDSSKCIRCRRCVSTCKVLGIDAIGELFKSENSPGMRRILLAQTSCVGCGQCVKSCPTGALFVLDETDLLWRAQNNKKKIIMGIMPESATGIGRFFGEKTEKNELEKLAAVCKKTGAAEVFDLSGLAEAAVRELPSNTTEATFCPAHIFPDTIHTRPLEAIFDQMVRERFGASEEVFTVFVSGCTATKQSHVSNAVLTTTELFQWIQRACVSRFTTFDVWRKTIGVEVEKLAPQTETMRSCALKLLCPGGCRNGGGQFRTKGFQK